MLELLTDSEGFNAVVKGKHGYFVFNKNDIYVGEALRKYGEYSENEVDLFRQICQPGLYVAEVGANLGAHTVPLAQLVGPQGRIFAFEPQRIVFQTLCANVAINSLENVECYQVAVAAEKGHVLIPDIRYDQKGNFGGVSVRAFQQGRKVPTEKLDDLLSEVPQLHFCKIDVEGMESEVLQGGKNLIEKFKPILYLENDRPEKSKELIELLWSMEYKLFWHLPLLYNRNNYAGDEEDIYHNIVSMNLLCIHNSLKMNLQGFHEVADSDFHPMRR
ncbi:MAG: FkbM family methyltransferase [Gemmataceae bacterium]